MAALRMLLRLARITLVAAWALGAWAVRRLRAGRLDSEARERLAGEVLATALERLGATFVKFGQILGTRPDLVGPGYVAALARLHDRVPPAPFREVERVLDADLAPAARARLAAIEPEPLAAASVAQVHRATLTSGERVALKVQRAAARAQIERDLALMTLGARVLDRLPPLKMLSLPGAVRHFGDAMHAQVDFRREAENNRRFAANFAGVEGVGVPALFPELCTGRVLAMELVEGVRATEAGPTREERAAIARRGAGAILQMVFVDGFVHADLHPGNILLTPDGRVVLIDLGLVAEIPTDLLRPWCETFSALAAQDGRELARLFYVHAPEIRGTSYDAFERDVVAHFDALYGKRLGDFETSRVLGGIMNVLRKHGVRIEPAFTVVHVALLVAEGLGKQLDPSIDLVAQAVPYLARAVATAPPGRAPVRALPS